MEIRSVARTMFASIFLALTLASSGLSAPILYPFGSPSVFQAFARIPEVDAFGIRDVTNAQKLALTGITAGQQVRISDAFVLSNDPTMMASGLYYDSGTSNGKRKYTPVVDAGGGNISWAIELLAWSDGSGTYSTDDVTNPWLGTDAGAEHAGYTMTHPALQVYLGGTISSEASWSTIDDVADATARLSLLGIPTGKQVHQVDNDTVYQYNGPSTDAVAGMIQVANPYLVSGTSNGKNYYNAVGADNDPAVKAIAWAAGQWNWYDRFGGIITHSPDDVATPNLATTWISIDPVITIDHIASEANWSVVP